MKKILSNIILFFLIFAILISFTGCQEEEEKKREEPIDYLDVGYYETLEEYEKWLSSNSSFLGNQFPTYQKIAMLGEFVGFRCYNADPSFPGVIVNAYYYYILNDQSGKIFSLVFDESRDSKFRLQDSGFTKTEETEFTTGIQYANIPFPPMSPCISYNSIQFGYLRYKAPNDTEKSRLEHIRWECNDYIFTLSVGDYPSEATDTFLGRMLTSFEAAEAGIKALNKSMFGPYDA